MAKLMFLLATVLLISWVQPGSAVKCYDCLVGCNDPFKVADATESVDTCTYCRKTKTKALTTYTTTRSCMTGTAPALKCDKIGISSANTETCFCDGALCNGATTMFISTATISLALLVAKVIF